MTPLRLVLFPLIAIATFSARTAEPVNRSKILGLLSPAQTPGSSVMLPVVISDHMVLQGGQPDLIWGSAAPGAAVKVDFGDGKTATLASAQTVVGTDGKWSVKLSPPPPGTVGELHFTAGTEPSVIVHDVAVGEVWLCSGQSNMAYLINSRNMPPEWIARAQKEASDAGGLIRYIGGSPLTGWQVSTPDTVGTCYAVAWNFAVALCEKLHRPIGLIDIAVGGSVVEGWIPRADVDACAVGAQVEERYQDAAARKLARIAKYKEDDAAWFKANPTPELQAQNKASCPRNPGRVSSVGDYYNFYIQWIVPYGIKGVIWFQADGNRDHPAEYGVLFQTLIKSWRRLWNEELPFYYVEMNNMLEKLQSAPVQPHWLPFLREQQEAGLELPKTDVACSIDTGDPVDVVNQPHFPNKKPVGQRLSLLALNNLYGMPCEAHSPQYESFTVEGNKIRVKIKYADGLRVRGYGKMIGFAIRGNGGDWLWADGEIQGNDIVLWNDQVPNPIAVRYAWAANPLISIENGTGLPMRPFRTDKGSPE